MVPTGIILDTAEAVQLLRNLPHSQEQSVWRMFITYVLEEIVDCLRLEKQGMAKLMQLCKEIEKGKWKQYFNQPEQLSDMVYHVGKYIHAQMVHAMTYDLDGVLRYCYYPVHAAHFNDLLLLREKELAAPQENSDANSNNPIPSGKE